MLVLKRIIKAPTHTIGALFLEKQFICFTLELPDKNNEKNISCIPSNLYKMSFENHVKFGSCYRLFDVLNRSGILIHSGNHLKDTRGCILVGLTCNFSGDSPVLEHSKLSIQALRHATNEAEKLSINIVEL